MPMSLPKNHQADWQLRIAELEDEANEAFLNRDIARLGRLFSDDLIVHSPMNRVSDKAMVLELLERGVIGHVSCELRHEVIRSDGDLVIVMGSDTVRNAATEPLLQRRVTNVWRKEGDDWRLYIRHATVVGAVTQDAQSAPSKA